MRAGAYDAHMARQYIQELRDLVQVGVPKKPSHPGYPGIIVGSLFRISLGIHIHCPEFQAGKRLSKEAYPFLNEENRPPGIKLDQYVKDGKEPAEDEDQGEKGEEDIEVSLCDQVTPFFT